MEYLSNTELKDLLTVAYQKDRTIHLFILTSLCHAFRCSEALSLTSADVDGAYLKVTALKDGQSRLEPLQASDNPVFDERLIAVHAHNRAGKLFPFSRATADRKIKQLCGLAGISKSKAHHHVLRHSNAMMVFRQTCSLGAVKQSLRHKSWSSSLVYLNEADSQKAFDSVANGLAAISN